MRVSSVARMPDRRNARKVRSISFMVMRILGIPPKGLQGSAALSAEGERVGIVVVAPDQRIVLRQQQFVVN